MLVLVGRTQNDLPFVKLDSKSAGEDTFCDSFSNIFGDDLHAYAEFNRAAPRFTPVFTHVRVITYEMAWFE